MKAMVLSGSPVGSNCCEDTPAQPALSMARPTAAFLKLFMLPLFPVLLRGAILRREAGLALGSRSHCGRPRAVAATGASVSQSTVRTTTRQAQRARLRRPGYPQR